MPRSVFVSSGQVNYLQNISVGHHFLHSDEPSDSGGKDAAPDPDELLLASLGGLHQYHGSNVCRKEGMAS